MSRKSRYFPVGAAILAVSVFALLGCPTPVAKTSSKTPALTGVQIVTPGEGTITLAKDTAETLEAQKIPDRAAGVIKWKSSDETYVTVNEDTGEITAQEVTPAAAPVKITAYIEGKEENFFDECTVVVVGEGEDVGSGSPTGATYHWKFDQAPDGWDNSGSVNNLTAVSAYMDSSNQKAMYLFGDIGSSKGTRFNTERTAPAGASKGIIQPDGTGTFAKVEDLEGPLSIKILYTDTGDTNKGRKAVIKINGVSVEGPAANGTGAAAIFEKTHDVEETVTIEFLGGGGGGLRYFDIIITEGDGGVSNPGDPGSPGGGDEPAPGSAGPNPVAVSSITLTGTSLYPNQTAYIAATVLPANASNKGLTWASSNTAAVTVDTNGRVSAISVGSAVITATAKDGSGKNGTYTVTVNPLPAGIINITESQGWLETAFVKWQEYTGADSYNVYYKGGAISEWRKIDTQLVRKYPTYYRADAPGLAAGSYNLKVVAVTGGSEVAASAAESPAVTVTAHDRSGFAFTGSVVPGAYKADGTLKPNARVIYVSNSNKETVTLSVKTAAAKETSGTGVSGILKLLEKGYEDRPLAIRFIGKIDVSGFTLEGGDLVLKDNGKNNTNGCVTLEGVGDDTVFYGFGIRGQRAERSEIANIAVILTASTSGDGTELQESEYVWVHNMDYFYGTDRGGDQKKGDGALDAKKCDNITFSYNHFWDTGKSNLLGNGTEPSGRHTYHHNWYDHSDSRHPRVRFHTVHVYNNYYDGVSKYGVGAAKGGPSIFVEANYFQNSKNPMLISMQGTDIAGGAGTFSSEDGGIIKAYNNYLDTTAVNTFKPYSASNTVEFDAYVVTGRNDTVPGTVKAKKGGAAYNNFDTASGMYAYTPDSPAQAKTNVNTYAGRYYGTDFSHTFTAADNTDYEVNAALKAKLTGYTSKLVSIQGLGSTGGGGSIEPDPNNPGTTDPTEPGTPGGGDISGSVVCYFTGATPSNSLFSVAGNYAANKGTVTVNGTSYSTCVKMESATKVSFTLSAPMTLKLYFGLTTDSAAGRKVKIDTVQNTVGSDGTVTVNLQSGSHIIEKGDSMHLFYISLTP